MIFLVYKVGEDRLDCVFIEARRLEIRYNLTKSWNAIWEDTQELQSLN